MTASTAIATAGASRSGNASPNRTNRGDEGTKSVGDPVTLEVDVMAKYVEKLLAAGVVPVAAAGQEKS